MKLIPYVRRSRKGEDDSLSLEGQRESIEKWAATAGIELLPFVEDSGVSGAKSWRNRELGEIVNRLKAGEADGVIVAYFSRLSREKLSATFEVLEELAPFTRVSAKTSRVVKPGLEIDLVDVIESWQARNEWVTLSQNLRAGKHFAWQRGILIGQTPVGYDSPQHLDTRGKLKRAALVKNEHAEVIGRAFTARARGASWSEVARVLTQGGVPTRSNTPTWTTSAAAQLTRNQLYKGIYRCRCGCNEEAQLPELAVVTPSVWQAAQVEKTKRKAGRRDPGKYLLSGLLFCECGYRMVHHTGTRPTYRCHAAGRCDVKATVGTKEMDRYIAECALESWLASEPSAGREATVEEQARLEHERDHARDTLAALVRMLDPLDPGAEDRLNEARSNLADAEAALVAAASVTRELIDPAEAKRLFDEVMDAETPDPEQRDAVRRMIRSQITGVRVARGSGKGNVQPVADRVTIDWQYRVIAA